mgnify:CR=1 FL=1
MAIKLNDEVSFKGRVAGIDGRGNAVVTLGDTKEGFTFRVPLKFVELADQRVAVPECVKDDLDKLFKKGRTSLNIAGVYWRSAPELTAEARKWIGRHETDFMHALVYGYKAGLKRKYYVKVFKAESYYYWKTNLDATGELFIATNTHSFPDEKQFTMDEIKKYGLEDCERIEVQEDE